MAVTATQEVFFWFEKHGVPDDNKVIYAAFPNISQSTLRSFKKRYTEGRIPKAPPEPPVATRNSVTVTPVTLDPNLKLDEKFMEQQILQCMLANPGDPRAVALGVNWLDKKKAIQPDQSVEMDEQSQFSIELNEVKAHVFATAQNNPTSDH